MGGGEIARFPPILQLAGVGLLALYVLLSLLGRVSGRLRWLWADADEARTTTHWMEYTIFPALLLAGAVWAVIANRDPAAPLTGGWTVRQLALGPGLALLGVLLVAAASVAQRARESAVKPAPAWIPPVMMLIGLAALIVGVLTLGRTVKGKGPSQLGVADRPASGAFVAGALEARLVPRSPQTVSGAGARKAVPAAVGDGAAVEAWASRVACWTVGHERFYARARSG